MGAMHLWVLRPTGSHRAALCGNSLLLSGVGRIVAAGLGNRPHPTLRQGTLAHRADAGGAAVRSPAPTPTTAAPGLSAPPAAHSQGLPRRNTAGYWKLSGQTARRPSPGPCTVMRTYQEPGRRSNAPDGGTGACR